MTGLERRRFAAVVFDFFGTLTLPVTHAVQIEAVGPIAALMGVTTEDLMATLAASFNDRCQGHWGSFEETMARLAVEVGADLSQEEFAEVCRVRFAGQRQHLMRTRPETGVVLEQLRRKGLRIGVVSDCTHELAMVWDELSLATSVDARALSIEEHTKKPDARLYLAVTDRLGVDPGRCLYVGDGGSNELTGASAVGMTAVLLDDPVGRTAIVYDRDGWDGPSIESLGEVLRVISGD